VAHFAEGCTVLNKLEACEDGPTEVRVNQRGDLSEFTSHPHAAAPLLDSNRILVAFVAQAADLSTSEVRVALIDQTTGERTIACESQFEYTLSAPGVLAYAASVAPVELTVAGQTAKAAVSWTEGMTDTRVKVVFVDLKGCPVSKPFSPVTDPSLATLGSSMAWSPTANKLLVAYHDYQHVLLSWITDDSPPPPTPIASVHRIDQLVTATIGEDGRGAVAWAAYPDANALTEGRVDVSMALLGADGALRPGATGAAEPFGVSLPVNYAAGRSADLNVALSKERYALTASLSDSSWARQVVYVTELSAENGATLTAPFRVEPDTGAAHYYGSLAYSPNGGLVAAWMSAQHGGTVARLFAPGGKPRFNSVSCDEGVFAVGARAKEGMQGQPSTLVTGNRVWVFHPGQPGYDAVAMGVVGWNMSWADLWPAK